MRIRYTSYLLLATLATGFLGSSCRNELDLQPESAVSPEQISPSNIGFFLNGLYRETMPARDNYVINDLRGGNYTWTALSGSGSVYGRMINGQIDDGISFSSSVWEYAYRNIYNANIIIQSADNLGAEGDIATVKAEASYLRAYLYYQLVTTFGGVPLITENTTENIPRNTAEEVWAQIIRDLDYAAANAGNIAGTGFKRVSSEAAEALRARALLGMGQQQEAAALARTVIEKAEAAGIGLDRDYGRIFQDTESSSEVIFAFANLETESNNRMSSLFWPYGTTWAGSYFVQPAAYVLTRLYDEGDTRREVNIGRVDNTDGTHLMIVSKYWDVQPLIVSRLSELFLICAEGLPREQGIGYLNDLRSVRGLEPLEAAEMRDEEGYLDMLLEERRRELYSEGFLFFDLVRTDRAIGLSNIQNRDQYLMPLPGDQVNLSNGVLEQNPEY